MELQGRTTGVGSGGAGCASAPPKVLNIWRLVAMLLFWTSEDLLPCYGENPGKITENRHELPENMSKNGAQHALIWKNSAQNVMKSFIVIFLFFGSHFLEFFSGKFGRIRAKILRTPKNCLLLHLGAGLAELVI